MAPKSMEEENFGTMMTHLDFVSLHKCSVFLRILSIFHLTVIFQVILKFDNYRGRTVTCGTYPPPPPPPPRKEKKCRALDMSQYTCAVYICVNLLPL